MIQKMFNPKVGRDWEMKVKTCHIQAAEEAFMDVLATSYAATTNRPKDTSYSYAENVLTERTLKGMLDDRFRKSLERWRQAPELMNAFTKRVFNQRTFKSPLATLVKKPLDSTFDEWRLNTKEETHKIEYSPHPVTLPSPWNTSTSNDLEDLARNKLESAC